MRPLDEPIHEQAAVALAALREPDLSAFGAERVALVMSRVFTQHGPRPDWLAALRSRIQELSFGMTSLQDADPSTFPFRVKNPATAYQRLVGLFRTELLIIGPFSRPFQFISVGPT
jgi:hypothetical protein